VRVQQVECHQRDGERPEDRKQAAQTGDPLRRDEQYAHYGTEDHAVSDLAPGRLHAGREASREQGNPDDLQPWRVRSTAPLQLGQLPVRAGGGQLAGDDLIHQELAVRYPVKPGELGRHPQRLGVWLRLRMADAEHRAFRDRQQVGVHPVGTRRKSTNGANGVVRTPLIGPFTAPMAPLVRGWATSARSS
jgi:hypothetical protein